MLFDICTLFSIKSLNFDNFNKHLKELENRSTRGIL